MMRKMVRKIAVMRKMMRKTMRKIIFMRKMMRKMMRKIAFMRNMMRKMKISSSEREYSKRHSNVIYWHKIFIVSRIKRLLFRIGLIRFRRKMLISHMFSTC